MWLLCLVDASCIFCAFVKPDGKKQWGIFINDDHRIIYTGSERNERGVALILHEDKRNCALGV